jgi:effector-binding domain-containing protein
MRRTILLAFAAAAILAAGTAAHMHAGSFQNVRVTIKEIDAFAYCGFPHSGDFSDLSVVLNSLLGAMTSQSIAPSGDLIAIYHLSPDGEIPDRIEYEVGFPITAQVWPQPPLNKKEWHYTMVASAVHRGSYDDSADTIEQILTWIDTNGYQQEGPILGRFTVIPSPEVRTRDLRTEIWIPVKRR